MKRTKEEADQTVKLLIEIGTVLFSERGYAAVSLEEIVQTANLTRGAVYHHFKNKKGLFLSVFEHTQKLIAEEISKVDDQSTDLWDQLIDGCRIFIEAASRTTICRIVLIDGPAVLGWQTFRKLDKKYSMNLLQEQIEVMQEQAIFKAVPSTALTHALSGAINEASIWVSEQENREKAIEDSMTAIEGMLEGFK